MEAIRSDLCYALECGSICTDNDCTDDPDVCNECDSAGKKAASVTASVFAARSVWKKAQACGKAAEDRIFPSFSDTHFVAECRKLYHAVYRDCFFCDPAVVWYDDEPAVTSLSG